MTPSGFRGALLRFALIGAIAALVGGCSTDGKSLVQPPSSGGGDGEALLLLSPGSVVFPLGGVVAETVLVSNEGEVTQTIDTISLQGADADEFRIILDTCSSVVLAPGSSCQIDIEFAPVPAGSTAPKTAILRIPLPEPLDQNADVELFGGETPRLLSSLEEITFDIIPVGSTASQTLEVFNAGNVGTTVDSVMMGGTDAAEFAIAADTCTGVALAVEESCEVEVQFAPLFGGEKSAEVVVSAASLTADLITAVTAEARSLTFLVDLGSVDFGDVPVGFESTAQTVTVENVSDGEITLGSIALGGPDAGEFVLDETGTCSGATLDLGETCVVAVRFAPASGGDKTASFTVVVGEDITSVTLTGTGLGSEIVVDPVFVDFGQANVGTADTASIQVSNTGSADLLIGEITVTSASGDFTIQSDGCSGRALAAGATPCEIVVGFSPAAIGSQTGTLAIASNDFVTPTVEVDVRGFGLSVLALSPPSFAFASLSVPNASSPAVFSVFNASEGDIELDAVRLSGAAASDFSLGTDTCSNQTLATQTECTFEVVFAPAVQGEKVASVAVASASSGIMLTAALNGTALVAQPSIEVAPGSGSFGDQLVGTVSAPTSFSISNLGTANLQLGTISMGSGPFAIASDACSGQVLSSADVPCQLEVVFEPSVFGDASGILTIPSNDPEQSELDVVLHGFGLSPVRVSPRTIGYGPVSLGEVSPAGTVTVSNDGNQPITIGGITLASIEARRESHFSVFSEDCGAKLAGQSDCTVEVRFLPRELGPLSDSLRIRTSASPTVEVMLSGFGQRTVTLNPTALDFGNISVGATSSTETVIVTNVGSSVVVIGDIDSVGDFVVANDSCSDTALLSSDQCSFDVSFLPVRAGLQDEEIVITWNGFVATVYVRGLGF